MTARFAVVGQPIAHSRSPQIHAAFAAAHGIAMTYERIEVAADALPGWVARFLADGGQGANVTLPHKQAAAALCATLGERARRAGAVNTLVRMEGDVGAHWHGDNTDGVGLVRDLTERTRFALKDARVLLLGAGGAARGVAPALLDAGIAALVVANRTPAAAVALCDALHDARVSPCALQDAGRHGAFDLVVNATAAGHMADAVAWPVGTIGPGTACVDLSYGPAAAPFLRHARVHGAAACVDGLGMLVEQAAESFFLWHGVRPDTQPVYATLRETLRAA